MKCEFCLQPAGFLKSYHDNCRQNVENSLKDIESIINIHKDDDMVTAMLEDESRLIQIQPSRTSEYESQTYSSFYEIIQKEDAYNKRLKLHLGIILAVSFTFIVGLSMFIKYRNEQTDGKIRVNYSPRDFEGDNYE